MRWLACAAVLCAIACAEIASSIPPIPKDEYRARRGALRKELENKGTLILAAAPTTGEELFGFQQEPNFLYLTGDDQPGAVLLMTGASEALFLPHHNEREERYEGRRLSAEDPGVNERTGFDRVLPIEKLESELARALETAPGVYALPDAPITEKLKPLLTLRTVSNAGPVVAKLREKKSAAELARIQFATDVSIEAHRNVWKQLAPGMREYQLAATFVDTFMKHGCSVSYAPIVGSGIDGTILHYSANSGAVDAGDLVVMDAAAECGNYASDITRTLPASGKFTPRQRELYEVVLGAQEAAIAAVKPGMMLTGEGPKSLNKIARDYIDTHGKDIQGKSLLKYFTHGLGHSVGIEVHDPLLPEPLQAGEVITIEPGIYIPEERIGIRIEDIVLVTDNGSRVLSAALPKDPAAVEAALAK